MAIDPRSGTTGDPLDEFLARQQAGGNGGEPPMPPGVKSGSQDQGQPSGLLSHVQSHAGAQGVGDHAALGLFAVLGVVGRKWGNMNAAEFRTQGRILLLALAVPAAIGRRVWGNRAVAADPRREAAHAKYQELLELRKAGVAVKPKDWNHATLNLQMAEILGLVGEALGPLGRIVKWALAALGWVIFVVLEVSVLGAPGGPSGLPWGPLFAILIAAGVWWVLHKRATFRASLGKPKGRVTWLFAPGEAGDVGGRADSGLTGSIAEGAYQRYLSSQGQSPSDTPSGAGGTGRPTAALPPPRWTGRGGPR